MILGAQDRGQRRTATCCSPSAPTARRARQARSPTLKRYGVDGFFYSKMSNRIAHVPESLNEYPVVMVDATDHENKSARASSRTSSMIGYDATNRLIQAGCKRIAYVGCAENTDRAGRSSCRLPHRVAGGRTCVQPIAGMQRSAQRSSFTRREQVVRRRASGRLLLLQ